jgi:hypothetical protein
MDHKGACTQTNNLIAVQEEQHIIAGQQSGCPRHHDLQILEASAGNSYLHDQMMGALKGLGHSDQGDGPDAVLVVIHSLVEDLASHHGLGL